jgi:ABC-type transporter Mla subunit MlaD
MNIAELISLAQAHLSRLDQVRSSAVQVGDVTQIAEIDRLVAETRATIDKLNTL